MSMTSTDNLERWRAKAAEEYAKDARIAELEAQLQEAYTVVSNAALDVLNIIKR